MPPSGDGWLAAAASAACSWRVAGRVQVAARVAAYLHRVRGAGVGGGGVSGGAAFAAAARLVTLAASRRGEGDSGATSPTRRGATGGGGLGFAFDHDHFVRARNDRGTSPSLSGLWTGVVAPGDRAEWRSLVPPVRPVGQRRALNQLATRAFEPCGDAAFAPWALGRCEWLQPLGEGFFGVSAPGADLCSEACRRG
jgi:hypothetical protein